MFQFEQLDSDIYKESGDIFGRFKLGPFNKNQATTIGNTLRRVLLGDLPGTAITAARIAGTNHEFSTIHGVREDILEILLNLKHIVLKSSLDQTSFGRLKIQGPQIITADQINLSPDITLINPNHYIATICDDSIVEMEFRIERGVGYRMFEQVNDDISVDFLKIDTVFMPVKKVNFNIETIYLNSIPINEYLILDIYTNGSITPRDSIESAANLVINLFNLFVTNPTEENEKESIKKANDLVIEELQLSVRAYNCLKRAQIHSVSDLLKYSPQDLQEIKNFGQKSAEEVFLALESKLGITLKSVE
jgi:DNA-directed RNA polymerase subunit alpha